jgi:hypothetical protein
MSDRAVQFCRRAGPIALLAVALSSEIFHASPVWAQERQSVELELVLAVDTSLSVNADEFAVQMDGLALAFRNRAVIAAIEAAGDNGIAVALVQWGIGQQQEITVGWTHVHDRTSAERFSRAIEASPRRFYGKGTGITHALQFASRIFEDNGYRGRRQVVDISGDGRNNSGRPPAMVRDLLVAAGIVVNGLAILDGDVMLGAYYAEQVAGGTASFVVTADTFQDYPAAIRRKLQREILAPMAGETAETSPPPT